MAPATAPAGDYVVVSDRFPYNVPHPTIPQRMQYRVLERGNTVSVEDGGLSQADADRGIAIGALRKTTGDADADAQTAAAADFGAMTLDQALDDGKAETLIGYLAQHPDDLDAVYSAELERSKPRKSVLELNPEHDHDAYVASLGQ